MTQPRLFLAITLLLLIFGNPALGDEKEDILDAVQKQYEKTITFKANFIQNSYLKIMDQTEVAKGEVVIKKPGKMKWNYKAPDPQILISNQNGVWLYLPDEKQVTKMQMGNIYSTNTPTLFLLGDGKLSEAFNVGQVLTNEDKITLILIPKDPGMNIEKLFLFVEPENYQITGSSVHDHLGNKTEILFNDIELNMVIANSLFDFKIPEGVELIDFSGKQ